MQTEWIKVDEPAAIEHTADVLRNGGLAAFPTDTVYGLGVLLSRLDALERLYLIKGQNQTRSISILFADPAQAGLFLNVPEEPLNRLAKAFWPGALTIVGAAKAGVPAGVIHEGMVGVRCPDLPLLSSLLQLAGPLAVSTANLPGEPFPVTAQGVHRQLNGRIHLLLDGGASPLGAVSTIVEIKPDQAPQVLRQGPVSEEAVRKARASG